MIDRRAFLSFAGLGLATLIMPRMALARAATEKRFVLVIQRGAADGLSTVIPSGDPGFASVRGALAEDAEGGTALGEFFTLHPALANTASLYRDRQALFVQAVASGYRERSHFDGQNVLETAGTGPYRLADGWLNRFLGLLPPQDNEAIGLASAVPAVLRGSAAVSSYAPSNLPDANSDLLLRVADMYERDPVLHPLWSDALETSEMAGDFSGNLRNGETLGTLAARLLSGPGAARIAVLETGGWDTHRNQRGGLARNLGRLDATIGALRDGLGTVWRDTLVIVATEFGRTVAPNGTGGTDHGTGSVAMLMGGAVAGGRVVADWPGLRNADLFEGRDLRPTQSIYGVIGGALAAHFGIDQGRVMRTAFPVAERGAAMEGLVRV